MHTLWWGRSKTSTTNFGGTKTITSAWSKTDSGSSRISNEGTGIQEISFDQPTALCFGSERDGASPTLTSLADEKVFIPMEGFVQSFNISVAAALCFQHIHREMKQSNLPALTDEERQKLLALYLYRSCKNPVLPPSL